VACSKEGHEEFMRLLKRFSKKCMPGFFVWSDVTIFGLSKEEVKFLSFKGVLLFLKKFPIQRIFIFLFLFPGNEPFISTKSCLISIIHYDYCIK
jgi:hypothetical protein